MSDLADFLMARIAEDERRLSLLDLPDYEVVLNSHGEVSARGGGWVTRGDCPVCGKYMFDGTESATEEAWREHAEEVHQRTRQLAECDAKRRLINAVVDQDPFDAMGAESAYEFLILSHLALPYADHPDYRDEWRP